MRRLGFSLIEVVVAVSVIAILSTIVIATMNRGSAQGRDTERAGDLRTMQAALELYRLENGEYPFGCLGSNQAVTGQWTGQAGSGATYECSIGQYIIGLAPKFIPVLPVDPKLAGENTGYLYITNAERTEYALVAKGTIETSVEQIGDCDAGSDSLAVWGGFASDTHSGCDLIADYPF